MPSHIKLPQNKQKLSTRSVKISKSRKHKSPGFTRKAQVFLKRYSRILVVAAILVTVIPFPVTIAKNIDVPFETVDKKSNKIELHETKVAQTGSNGKKDVIVKAHQNFLGWIFGKQPFNQHEVSSTIAQKPVNKIVVHGTKKYQYMLCSDGSSRYYTNEQFKDPNTGFTYKSEDYCKANNQGVKLSLTNTNPSTAGSTPFNKPSINTQTDLREAEKIDRKREKLLWCSKQYDKIFNEYIDKVHQAQATQDITNEDFNAIVDPAYWKYSLNTNNLKSSGCNIIVTAPNYIRQ